MKNKSKIKPNNMLVIKFNNWSINTEPILETDYRYFVLCFNYI